MIEYCILFFIVYISFFKIRVNKGDQFITIFTEEQLLEFAGPAAKQRINIDDQEHER